MTANPQKSKTLAILFIEDDLAEAHLVTLLLQEIKKYRFSVTQCQTLAESLKALDQSDYDIILLDLNLPDSTGIGTIKKLVDKKPDLPLVVLTGDESETTQEEIILFGAQEYLAKSDANPQTLLRAISYTLDRAKLLSDLRAEKNRLADFANATADFFWELDPNLAFRWFSPGLYEFFELDSDSLFGTPFEKLNSFKDDAFGWTELLDFLALKEQVKNFEIRLATRKNGMRKWLRINAIPMIEGGRFSGYRGTGTDITPLKETQAALEQSNRWREQIVSASGIGLWDWDLITDTIQWDLRCFNILGYATKLAPTSYVQLKSNLIHPDDQHRFHETILSELLAAGGFKGLEIRIKNSNGGWSWVELQGKNFHYDSTGNPTRIAGTMLNIDDRKRALERTDKLLQASVAIIYTCNPQDLSVINYISPNIKNILGYTASSISDKQGWLETHVRPNHYSARREKIEAWLKSQAIGVLLTEYQIIATNGHFRWIEDQLIALKDETGAIVELIGAMTDSTNKVEMNRRLVDRESLLQSTISSLDDMLLVFDKSGIILDVHLPPLFSGYPFSTVKMVGKSFAEVLPGPWTAAISEAVTTLSESGTVQDFSFHQTSAGKTGWYSARLLPRLGVSDMPTPGFVCLIHDDTDKVESNKRLNESEHLFHAIFQNSTIGIVIFDEKDFRVITANKSFLDTFGYDRESLADLDLDVLFCTTSSHEHWWKIFSNAVGAEPVYKEVTFVHKQGWFIHSEVTGRRVKYNNQDLVMGIVRDITKRRMAEIEREDYRNKLEILNSELEQRVTYELERNQEQERLMMNQSRFIQMGEMLSMIAHQWRQPLNSISLAAINLVIEEELGETDRRQILETGRFIQAQAEKMSVTITDFMEFFRPSRTQDAFSIGDVIFDVKNIIESQLEARDIAFHVDFENLDQKNVLLRGQKNELAHVILNCIGNSRDALEECNAEKKFIRVKVYAVDHHLEIRIKDNGGGISEKHLDRVFDPYFTSKPQGKGTGIGLYMSRTIIERNFSGLITIENEDLGAVVSISIPLSVESAESTQ